MYHYHRLRSLLNVHLSQQRLLGAKGSRIAHGHFVIFTRLNSLAVLHMVNRLQHLTPPDHHQLAQVGSQSPVSTSWSQSLASYSTSWSQSPISTTWSQSPVKHKLVTISRQL